MLRFRNRRDSSQFTMSFKLDEMFKTQWLTMMLLTLQAIKLLKIKRKTSLTMLVNTICRSLVKNISYRLNTILRKKKLRATLTKAIMKILVQTHGYPRRRYLQNLAQRMLKNMQPIFLSTLIVPMERLIRCVFQPLISSSLITS